MENVFPPADPLCPGNPRPMIPAPENNNSSNYCRCAPAPAIFFPSVPLLLTAFRLRSDCAHRHLRGRLPCAVKPIGPHRASEYALHLSGTAFGLLGVMLEGLRGSRHRLPPPRAVPQPVSSCLQIDLRESFGTATLPTGTSVAILRGEGVFWPLFGTATPPTGISVPSRRGEGVSCRLYGRSSSRRPCPHVLQWHPRVAKMVFYLRSSMK